MGVEQCKHTPLLTLLICWEYFSPLAPNYKFVLKIKADISKKVPNRKELLGREFWLFFGEGKP